jgi:lipopolysaccharide export system permease protein
MSLNQLSKFIDRNKEAGLDTLRYEVDYHAKFGFAFAAVVMSFLAIPFSVTRARSGGAFASLGFCLLLAFGYWASYSSALTLGQHGAIPPILAAWGPNIIAIALATFFLLRIKR